MSGMTGNEPTEPGEEGELAAGKGEPPPTNPYPAGSAEAEDWLDGHNYAPSKDAEDTTSG